MTNNSPRVLQGLLNIIGHVVPTAIMVIDTIMDIIHSSHIRVHCLILVVNHILVSPIQVVEIKATYRFSTIGLLITETVIIIVPQFMVVI